MKEMGIKYDRENRKFEYADTNNIYELMENNVIEEIINKHKKFCIDIGINVDSDVSLPVIYALPKLHKNPVKFRFITGGHNSSLKTLSMEMHTICTHIKKHFINYTKVIQNRNKTIKTYWSINNINISQELNSFEHSNIKIFTAHFLDMFTNLDHGIILKNIIDLLNIVFKNANKNFIVTIGFRVYYTDGMEIKNNYRYYRKEDLIHSTEYLLDNSYCIFSKKIFKQKKGVPQGGNLVLYLPT